MINIQNLGSKKGIGVKFKDGICTELCLKLWFESDWHFCNITESRWFSKRLSRKKVLNNHFLKSYQKRPFADVLKIGVLRNFAVHRKKSVLEFLFNKVATLFKRDFNTGVFL